MNAVSGSDHELGAHKTKENEVRYVILCFLHISQNL